MHHAHSIKVIFKSNAIQAKNAFVIKGVMCFFRSKSRTTKPRQ
jgi:hypothetical protein